MKCKHGPGSGLGCTGDRGRAGPTTVRPGKSIQNHRQSSRSRLTKNSDGESETGQTNSGMHSIVRDEQAPSCGSGNFALECITHSGWTSHYARKVPTAVIQDRSVFGRSTVVPWKTPTIPSVSIKAMNGETSMSCVETISVELSLVTDDDKS